MDEAKIAELVARACDEVLDCLDGIINVDWNDLGEVTIVTSTGGPETVKTFRLTAVLLGDDA